MLHTETVNMMEQKRHRVTKAQLLTLRILASAAGSDLREDKSPAKLC